MSWDVVRWVLEADAPGLTFGSVGSIAHLAPVFTSPNTALVSTLSCSKKSRILVPLLFPICAHRHVVGIPVIPFSLPAIGQWTNPWCSRCCIQLSTLQATLPMMTSLQTTLAPKVGSHLGSLHPPPPTRACSLDQPVASRPSLTRYVGSVRPLDPESALEAGFAMQGCALLGR